MDFLSLPTEIIVKILSEISTFHLLKSVSRTCKQLHDIVEQHSILWRDIVFDTEYEINSDILKRLLTHSAGFEQLLLGYTLNTIPCFEIDNLFVLNLQNAKRLFWLDLTDSSISTLCFLEFLPSLKILNISQCKNLVDADFHVLSKCKSLDQLYLSYTNVRPESVVMICSTLELIVVDLSGIALTVKQCDDIIKPCMIYIQVHFDNNEPDFAINDLIEKHRDLQIKRILSTAHN